MNSVFQIIMLDLLLLLQSCAEKKVLFRLNWKFMIVIKSYSENLRKSCLILYQMYNEFESYCEVLYN